MSNKIKIALVLTALILALVLGRKFILNKIFMENVISKDQPTTTITSIPKPTTTSTSTPTPDIFQGLKSEKFYITFYGWPDNDPPGNAIAYPKNKYANAKHNFASGVGTYSNPITFASGEGNIKIGTIFYIRYLQKYIVMEDLCASCNEKNHIDIWMESNASFTEELFACQRKLTRGAVEVFTDPPPTLPVKAMPLFDKPKGVCNY